MSAFIHEHAIVEAGAQLGLHSRVWAFTHILSGAVIGDDCNICDHVFIENEVHIGSRVTIKCGVQLWDGLVIHDDVFIGPNVTFTNDPFPRSKHHLQQYSKTIIREKASIGANATILPGITVGTAAMVGAGSVVTKNVPAYAIVTGNPARITGYVTQSQTTRIQSQQNKHSEIECIEALPGNARLIELPLVNDLRGNLSVGEYSKDLPFIAKRYFVVFDVPTKEVRGEHAHKELKQFLVCLKGSCKVVVDDGNNRSEIILDQPNLGLYIPPMVWATQYQYTEDAVLLVLASEKYDPEDYIRDYDVFLAGIKYKQNGQKAEMTVG